MEIIETFYKQKKTQTKLYFKVKERGSEPKSPINLIEAPKDIETGRKSSFKVKSMDSFRNGTPRMNKIESFRIIKGETGALLPGPQAETIEPGENEQYIELFLKRVEMQDMEEIQLLISLNDITMIIQNQQKLSDKMYQDAIEANYSHE